MADSTAATGDVRIWGKAKKKITLLHMLRIFVNDLHQIYSKKLLMKKITISYRLTFFSDRSHARHANASEASSVGDVCITRMVIWKCYFKLNHICLNATHEIAIFSFF